MLNNNLNKNKKPNIDLVKNWNVINITSYNDLVKYENQILERIENYPFGAHLFVLNPFVLLEDIKVNIAKKVKTLIIENEPSLGCRSSIPYKALKNTKSLQVLTYKIKGLFPKGGS